MTTKTDDVLDARRKFSAELRHQARVLHRKEFGELSSAEGARLVRKVSDEHPAWRAALDDSPGLPAPDWSVEELRDATPSRADRERDAARELGFSEDAVRADPLRRDMVQTRAAFAERDQVAADVEREVAAVAAELRVDPTDYGSRQKVFAELARRGHPLATSRRFERLT